MEKTDEHFQEAMVENKNSFRAVDPDGDGENRGSPHPLMFGVWPVWAMSQHCVLN